MAYSYENNIITNDKEIVTIIDIGYKYMKIIIMEQKNKVYSLYIQECKILNCYNNYEVGGIYIDDLLYKKIVEKMKNSDVEFDENNKKNIKSIMTELIKTKEKLSAQGSTEVAISIDLLDDESYEGTFSVDEINDSLKGLKPIIEEELDKIKDVSFNKCVIFGGSLRIQFIQDLILEKIKEKVPVFTKTLNMDEACAFGCLYHNLSEWKYSSDVKEINNEEIIINDDMFYEEKFNSVKKVLDEDKKRKDYITLKNSFEEKIYFYTRELNKLIEIINSSDNLKEIIKPIEV